MTNGSKPKDSAHDSSGLPDPQRLRGWAPSLTELQFESAQIYIRELSRFNKTLNLISPGTMPRVDAVHVLDSVRAWTLVAPRIPVGSLVYDLGSGNGLPGLLSAVMAPDRAFRLVDRDQRKLEFCKHVASAMGLKNVSTECIDIDRLPASSINFALSRGFASVTKALLMTRKLFAVGGSFFMLKGDSWTLEISDLPPRLFGSWKVELVGKYELPELSADFVVIECQRLAESGTSEKS
ncbi:hypothetical protein BH10BDE1_BH10BDE1_22200 [soil metagenome]